MALASPTPLRIAVFGPHPDDQELGMGGTIALLASQGHIVTLVDMSDGEPTPKGSPEIRMREAAEAARVLGVTRVQLGLRNREFVADPASRRVVAEVIRALQADVLFAPYPEDAHPDHVAAAALVRDARFWAKLVKSDLAGAPCHPRRIFHYWCTHLRNVPQPTFCVDISGFEGAKQKAILCYRSQFADHAPNLGVPDRVAAGDRYFGGRIGAAAAEPFFSPEVVGLRDLDALCGSVP
jgi:bacillithiol biosynthesis deacetylase BshB1